MTDPTSAVEQAVQARIDAARVKVADAKQRRDELSAARRRGLAARHANKLRHLAEAEQRRLEADRQSCEQGPFAPHGDDERDDGGQDDEQHQPKPPPDQRHHHAGRTPS